jgi:hypothetical protein
LKTDREEFEREQFKWRAQRSQNLNDFELLTRQKDRVKPQLRAEVQKECYDEAVSNIK